MNVGEREEVDAPLVEAKGPLFLPVAQPGPAEKAVDKLGPEGPAFGLGEVEYSATLAIEYELLDK